MTLKNVGKIFDYSIEQESSASHISSTIVTLPTIQKSIAPPLTPQPSQPSLSAGCCQAHFLPGPEPSLRCGGARWWSDVRCDRLPGCIGPATRCAHVRPGGTKGWRSQGAGSTAHPGPVLTTGQDGTWEEEEAEEGWQSMWHLDRGNKWRIWWEGGVAGSRHTLKQIIMPGRFSTVMKPKVNCSTIRASQTWSRAVQRSHSKSCKFLQLQHVAITSSTKL